MTRDKSGKEVVFEKNFVKNIVAGADDLDDRGGGFCATG